MMNQTNTSNTTGRRAFTDVTNKAVNSNNNDNNKGKVSLQPALKKSNVSVFRERVVVEDNNNNNATSEQQQGMPLQRQMSSSLNIQPSASMSYQHTGKVDMIDMRDAHDPLCVTEYVSGMYDHFRIKEKTAKVQPNYMTGQHSINERMRSILVDWLIDVHLKHKLVPETLYLTVNIIDRYLEKCQVLRPKLQLVGVTALLLASKYEDIYPPSIRELVNICDNAYSKQEIIAMEEKILKAVEYKITVPSAHAFLVRYLKAGHANRTIVQLSCYILDGTLQHYSLLQYLPSQLAAAAVLIARKIEGRNAWSPTLLKYAEYYEEDIIPVARNIMREKNASLQGSNKLKAVIKKYSSSKYGSVARSTLDCDL